MPRGKRMTYAEFMERMALYYPLLRMHLETCIHEDSDKPPLCEMCLGYLRRGSDSARYLGKVDLYRRQELVLKEEVRGLGDDALRRKIAKGIPDDE